MLRATLVGLALFVFAASASARAENYSDTEGNFRLTVPDGWTGKKFDNPFIRYFMFSPRLHETFGNCLVFTQPHPETKGLSQAQLDAKLGALIDEKFWKTALVFSPGLDGSDVISSATEIKHGRQVYSVTTSFKITAKDSDQAAPMQISGKGIEYFVAIPGQFFFVACSAREEGYPREESDFHVAFDSFEPLSDAAVASAAPNGVPSLTLYSLARFGGVSHVVTQDTPDLALFGWRNGTASVGVAGGTQWEVCDGANYTGKCSVVTGALAGFGQTSASARRYNDKAAAPRLLLRTLQTELQSAMAATIDRTR